MASIKVGGVTYTTNYAIGDIPFYSYINIRPLLPYSLLVSHLSTYVDIHAYSDSVYDVDVYYWVAPNGLRFLVNRGLDAPLSPPYEGLNFKTSYHKLTVFGRFYRAGIVVNKDFDSPSVSLADIYNFHPDASQKMVRFNQRSTIMRAVRCRVDVTSDLNNDSRTQWRLWDNFGCEHVFRLGQADGGNVIALEEG